jgi:hypothetical protein
MKEWNEKNLEEFRALVKIQNDAYDYFEKCGRVDRYILMKTIKLGYRQYGWTPEEFENMRQRHRC